MPPPPNEVYSGFSFIGFVLSVIPLYWHVAAWNTGTCFFMFWTGLGCLIQCINSIVWNKNMIDKAPAYCDFVVIVQVALNTAIPACSLCINRRLYKIATMKAVMITREEKRRAVVQDLLICLGLPILQVLCHYIVMPNRYDIYEDFGPIFNTADMVPAYFLYHAWPVAIGLVSFSYCSRTLYTFYKRRRQFKEILSSTPGLNRSRYIRLMIISSTDMCFTVPLGTYYIVLNATNGVVPWKSWADTHSNYSTVNQVPASFWKNNTYLVVGQELYRWSLVACAFLFFAFFGFADEARQHYRRVYTTLASRIGYSTFTLQGSSHATSSVPFVKSKAGVNISVVTTGEQTIKRRSSISFTDLPSTAPSIGLDTDFKTDLKIDEYSPSGSMSSASMESFVEREEQDQLPALPAGIHPTVPPASFLPPCEPSGDDAV